MSTVVLTESLSPSITAERTLAMAARFWFVVAVAGQWMFAYYIAALYGGSALRGHWEVWNKRMSHGHGPATIGDIAMVVHLFLAAAITFGGPLQLIPQLRRRLPKFHRWNGRVYAVALFIAAIAALYMVWFRGTAGDFSQHVGVSLDAVLIMIFAVVAVRYAIARDFKTHRRWALRLFMVVNGVWFFRVGMMFWLVINRGPAGFNPKMFTGPFLTFWPFANYFLPSPSSSSTSAPPIAQTRPSASQWPAPCSC
jgi:chromate transport protein ChrA